ncbi:putative Ribosomal protein S9 [Melia azedarach]|uniref:Ribosomal protein S9 n=1 Tax=Melia azedarach TaxID=155640 RepID=A0ACC1X1C7_MELAZ|nr:putative Ribosomal protein S9 [Melia azedarach]
MLSRLLPKPSHFRQLINLSAKSNPYPQNSNFSPLLNLSRFLSTNNNNGSNHDNNSNNKDSSTSNIWNLSRENDGKFDQLFTETEAKSGGGDEWLTAAGAEEYKPWKLVDEVKDDVFDLGESVQPVAESVGDEGSTSVESVRTEEEERQLQMEEKELTAVLQGPNRAFGDLIAASGITDAMLESLIALKDLEGVEGLPPLSEIEDIRYEKNTRKSTRAEIERQKQEEVAKARVRQVDDKGRAYGTGRRKCSIARVWVQPGDGKFIVNDKEFDVYFPMLEHRATLLRPFSETKTLGLWDVDCTVKGGGVSGFVLN